VPIGAGARVTGKVGDYGIGVVNVQTRDPGEFTPDPTNFTVVRVKRDILRRSAIGGIFTHRSIAAGGEGRNQAYGLDAAFSFYDNLRMGGYLARTSTVEGGGDADSYLALFDWSADRYGFKVEQLKVGEAFNPEVGFVRRSDFVKSSMSARFSPRPANIPSVRKFSWDASVDYYETGAGRIESREQQLRFNAEMASSANYSASYTRSHEVLVEPFRIASGVFVPVGDYDFSSFRASIQFPQQYLVSGTVAVERGSFYGGTLTSLNLFQGRAVVSNQFSLEPGVSMNWIDLPGEEQVRQTLLRSRADFAFTSRMFASALVQYNAIDKTLSSNLRYRWEYEPGSELFVVWTDERDTQPGGTGLRNRALIFKITRLLRY